MEIKLTAENFEDEVLKSDKPVLVDFWAEWCMPCKMLAPVIEETANERTDIKVGKVNVDEEIQLAYMFKVSSIPLLILFKNGEVVAKTVGVQEKEDILKMVEEAEENNGD